MKAFLNEELNAITSRLAEAMLDRGAKISEKKTMNTPIKLICLTTLLVSALVIPQKLANSSIAEHLFNKSQQQLLLAKSKTDSKSCSSSPSPGCSRRDWQAIAETRLFES